MNCVLLVFGVRVFGLNVLRICLCLLNYVFVWCVLLVNEGLGVIEKMMFRGLRGVFLFNVVKRWVI